MISLKWRTWISLMKTRKRPTFGQWPKKEKIKKYFDKEVQSRDFHQGDLVLQRVDGPREQANEGEMVVCQEAPYRIAKIL